MERIAIIQKPPVFLNRAETLRNAVSAVGEAVKGGAQLIVFPEAFIPGYPAWIWRLRPGSDLGLAEQLHALLLANAVSLDGDDLAPLYQAASNGMDSSSPNRHRCARLEVVSTSQQ